MCIQTCKGHYLKTMKKKNHNSWKYLSVLFKEKLGVPTEVFAVMCTRAVLLLCASGLSNETIASFLMTDTKTVDDYVNIAFGFNGWDKDLDFSPLHYLKTGRKLYTNRQSEVCRKYIELYSKVEPYYK